MISTKCSAFFDPLPCLHYELISAKNSPNLPNYVRFSLTPPPPSDADIISEGHPLESANLRLQFLQNKLRPI